MKKIIITESQLKKITERFIGEQFENEKNKYKIDTENVYLYFHDLKYNDFLVTDAKIENFPITFNIHIKKTPNGIESATPSNIKGPAAVTLFIKYKSETDNTDEISNDAFMVSLPWKNDELIHYEYRETGMIGVHDDIGIYLNNNENGDIFVNGMTIFVREV